MPAFRNRMWDGKIRIFTLRDKTLPAGLFYHLNEFCDKRGYILKSETSDFGAPDERIHITRSSLDNFCNSLNTPFPLREYQYQCVGEAITRKRAILLSPTGSGKSFIIYTLIRWYLENYNDKILIIVPTTSLVEQMNSDFWEYGFDVDNEVHKIYSGKDKDTDCFGSKACLSCFVAEG